MDKNICHECGTENEQEYTYCKNCGALLEEKTEAPEPEQSQSNAYEQYAQTNANYTNYQNAPFQNPYYTEYIDGIPKEEIALYVGRKVYDIMPKFNKMELTQSKFSWCWPAAIFGFLFGPLGSALWFFYRKMYKPAVILSVIGAVLTIITTVLTASTTSLTLDAFLNAFESGDFTSAIESLEEIEAHPDTITVIIANLINNISTTATGILCGLFGFYIYKKHCVNKILAFRSMQNNPTYYRLGLPAIGGVSGGMLALGIGIMAGVSYIASFITVIISMIF